MGAKVCAVWMIVGLCVWVSACGGGGGEAPRVPDPPTLASITVFPSSAQIPVGGTQQYTTVFKDTHGNTLNGLSVTWSTTTAVATIDAAGLATGQTAGVSTVTASREGISSQFVTLTVTAPVAEPVKPIEPIEPIEPVKPIEPIAPLAPLPPWLTYCNNALCAALAPVVAAVCPSGTPSCTSSRHTTVLPQVNGIQVSGIALPLIKDLTLNGQILPETVVRLLSGNGVAFNGAPLFVLAYTASSVQLQSDGEFLVSYYGVSPVWQNETPVNFTTTQLTSPLLDTVFYQHPSYNTGSAAADLHAQGQTIIETERAITGITPSEHVTAYILPTELTVARDHEGTVSFGNGTIGVNYGHPLYITALGGILPVAVPALAHEYAHEVFDEIKGAFLDNFACLNEGQANALGVTAGFIPEAKLGPSGLRAQDFRDGCLMNTEIHDVGNCYFYHVKQAGLLTESFMRGIYHPQHTFVFDSCVMNTETGNSLLVYFTESANGANLIPVLNAMKIPHADSYTAAKLALGF